MAPYAPALVVMTTTARMRKHLLSNTPLNNMIILYILGAVIVFNIAVMMFAEFIQQLGALIWGESATQTAKPSQLSPEARDL